MAVAPRKGRKARTIDEHLERLRREERGFRVAAVASFVVGLVVIYLLLDDFFRSPTGWMVVIAMTVFGLRHQHLKGRIEDILLLRQTHEDMAAE